MTAVSAPPTATGLAAIAPLAVAGNNAAAGNNGLPADFASMLKVLQSLTGEITPTANGSAAPMDSGFSAVLQELKANESDDNDDAVDIAAMLSQLGAQTATPPTLPALTPEASRANLVMLPGSDDEGTPAHKVQEMPPLSTAVESSDEPASLAGKSLGEGTPEFSLPDTPATDPASLRSADVNPARGPHTERAKLDVAVPVQSPNWSNEVGQRVVWMAKNNVQEAQLSVNPPHLGPIEITLSLKDDSATARFFSPHAEVREVLEQALPRLREMLAGAGVQLGQSDVGAQSQQAFQQFAGRQNGNGNGHPSFSEEHPSLHAPHAVNQTGAVHARQGNGLVDTFV